MKYRGMKAQLQTKSLQYTLNKRLDKHNYHSGHLGEKKNVSAFVIQTTA